MASFVDQRAYSRGYYAGMKRVMRTVWPDFAPPSPPEPHVAALVEALKRLAEAGAHVVQVIEPDEPIFQELHEASLHADGVLKNLTDWLKSIPLPASPSPQPAEPK